MKVFDPQERFLQKWNKIFVLTCIFALSVDALFLYIPVVNYKSSEYKCLGMDNNLEIIASVLRCVIDLFYMLHIIFKFRTGFIAPVSRVFGRGLLVVDLQAIAGHYLTKYFFVDLLAVLPLPQIAILVIEKRILKPSTANDLLKFIVIFQCVPRLIRIYPLLHDATRSSGLITENNWGQTVLYLSLLLYVLASHIFGALWYMLSLMRQDTCWRKACRDNKISISSLYCGRQGNDKTVLNILNSRCPTNDTKDAPFDFGIYLSALQNVAPTHDFLKKFFFCFRWGLQTLSSLGQGLNPSTSVPENLFTALIVISGLLFMAFLIGYMQRILQLMIVGSEEMWVNKQAVEQWMTHRLLPENLRERIRRYEQYKWQKTRGVNEELILGNLPQGLRRDVKRHLCLALLKRVPLFENMDEQLMDTMLDRLKLVLYTEKFCIIREGDPIYEMLFIKQGKFNSWTTGGHQPEFFNEVTLHPGDFCGEELMSWALDLRGVTKLPISTRTIVALEKVEAFTLSANDLAFVLTQYRRFDWKQLSHTFRFFSKNWRTWAACFIQAAWRRYVRKTHEELLREEENRLQVVLAKTGGRPPSLGATVYASQFAVKALKSLKRKGACKARLQERMPMILLQKPPEPDFTGK